MEGERGNRAAGPFGLERELEETLIFCCYSGRNLCKAARMSPGHKSFQTQVQCM